MKKMKTCPYCLNEYKEEEMTKEHIIQMALGGSQSILICDSCNGFLSTYDEEAVSQDIYRLATSKAQIKGHKGKLARFESKNATFQDGTKAKVTIQGSHIKPEVSISVNDINRTDGKIEKKFFGSDKEKIEKISNGISQRLKDVKIETKISKIEPKISIPIRHSYEIEEWSYVKILFNFTYYILNEDMFKLPQFDEWRRFVRKDLKKGNTLKGGLDETKSFGSIFNKLKNNHILFCYEINNGQNERSLAIGVSLFGYMFYYIIIDIPSNFGTIENIVCINYLPPAKKWIKYTLIEFIQEFS